ncbi:MAG: glycoside hydrolase family 20 zincin-like fold domain-containing protein [Candidatus Eisenbacteria bacterium]
MNNRTYLKTSGFALAFVCLVSLFVPKYSAAFKYLPSADFVKAAILPEPVKLEWKLREPFDLTTTSTIFLPAAASREERELAEWVRLGMYNLFGVQPDIMVTDLIPAQNAIILGRLDTSPVVKELLPGVSREQFGNFPDQGYVISSNAQRVTVIGVGMLGLKNAAQTFLQLVAVDRERHKHVVPPVEIVDFPAVDMRALLLPVRSFKQLMQMEHARELINLGEMLHMNTVILQIDNGFKFESVPEVSRTDGFPMDTLRALVRYAREADMEVIPLVNTLSDQHYLLCAVHPNLCLDKYTYDPSDERVYGKLFPILDEIIEVCQPKYMHVGHSWLRVFSNMKDERAQGLFLKDVGKIYDHLKKKNVQMMMWSDMLLDGTQFPGQDLCYGRLGNIHAVIDSLPKDIILVDAHQQQREPKFKTVDYLTSKGFRVLGCVALDKATSDQFSKYVAEGYMGNWEGKFLGMALALWGMFDYEGMSTPRRLARECAEAFWRGGRPPEDPMGENRPVVYRPTEKEQ